MKLENLETKPVVKKQENSILTLAKYSSVGYYLSTPIFIGVILGWYLDKHLGSHPKGILISIVVGTIFSFLNLFKLTKESG